MIRTFFFVYLHALCFWYVFFFFYTTTEFSVFVLNKISFMKWFFFYWFSFEVLCGVFLSCFYFGFVIICRTLNILVNHLSDLQSTKLIKSHLLRYSSWYCVTHCFTTNTFTTSSNSFTTMFNFELMVRYLFMFLFLFLFILFLFTFMIL